MPRTKPEIFAFALGLVLGWGSTAQAQQAVQTQPAPLACINHAGALAAGGVAQIAIPANPLRRGFFLQNSSSGPLTYTTSGPATAASATLAPGVMILSPTWGVPTAALSVWGATTGQTYSAEECF